MTTTSHAPWEFVLGAIDYFVSLSVRLPFPLPGQLPHSSSAGKEIAQGDLQPSEKAGQTHLKRDDLTFLGRWFVNLTLTVSDALGNGVGGYEVTSQLDSCSQMLGKVL